MKNPQQRLEEIQKRLEALPKGTLTYKKIGGKEQPYLQRTVNGKSASSYIKTGVRDQVMKELKERADLLKERDQLLDCLEQTKALLEKYPALGKRVGIGYQRFEDIRSQDLFYVDKTHFIREWWDRGAQVTLITRPGRFGKTLMMSTVECFFSPQFADHPEYFTDLDIWKDDAMRRLYGRIPVISLSFGGAKGGSFEQAIRSITYDLGECLNRYDFLETSEKLPESTRNHLAMIRQRLFDGDPVTAAIAVPALCEMIYRHYGVKPILLLDEYETPLMEACAAGNRHQNGYEEQMTAFCRQFFYETFKKNRFFSRAIITGVTKITKHSLFSDINNISACTITDSAYSDCFGFTEQETEAALQCQNAGNTGTMDDIRQMYDGFICGRTLHMYNPWTICCYLADSNLISYWTGAAGNDLIGNLIRSGSVSLKQDIAKLIRGEKLHMRIREEAALEYRDGSGEAFWALLLAAGYIKAEKAEKKLDYTEADVSITNKETLSMIQAQILRMFPLGRSVCREFAAALLQRDPEKSGRLLYDLTFTSLRYFDNGRRPSEKAEENFGQGLILALTAILGDDYRITAKEENEPGWHNIQMIPLQKTKDTRIIDFKMNIEKGQVIYE